MEGRLVEGKEQALPVSPAHRAQGESVSGIHTGPAEVWLPTWGAQVRAEVELWLQE